MQTVIHVTCKRNESLRQRILDDDTQLGRYGLEIAQRKVHDRNPGWAKIHGTDYAAPGALNFDWDGPTKTLTVRAVNKQGKKPDVLVGRFVAYLLGRHRSRIRAMVVLPE